MKQQNKKADHINESTKKRTPLDSFKLFYEEIPLEVDTPQKKQQSGSNDRLSRRSRR